MKTETTQSLEEQPEEEAEPKRGRPEIFFKYDGTMEELAQALFDRPPGPEPSDPQAP